MPEPKPSISPASSQRSAADVPDTELVPPVHELVADSYEIIKSELRVLRRKQSGGVALSEGDVLRMQRLMNALAKAHRAQLDALEAEDFSKLDRAQLVAQLKKELGAKELGDGVLKER